ncbi:MAG TPA: YciI family protein [bacterium]|nr:YciI family protein [bacterium]
MKYACLIYNKKKDPDGAAAHGRDALTVRVRNGRLSAAEGPAAEGPAADPEERLHRVVLIQARDLNDAVRVAARMPEAQFGSIEIRPVEEPG